MQFGFPRDRQLRYADFAKLRPAQKRGRAFMYLKLATLYTKYCRTYRPKFLRTVAMVAAVLGAGAVMQSAHMMPDWIPVWFLGVLAWNHSVVRAPDLHPNVLFFLRDAGATTASIIPADLLRLDLPHHPLDERQPRGVCPRGRKGDGDRRGCQGGSRGAGARGTGMPGRRRQLIGQLRICVPCISTAM